MFMLLSSRECSPGSFDECRLSAGWPPTPRPIQSTWVASPPNAVRHRHLLLLLGPQADTHFTVPQRAKAESIYKHRSKGAQRVITVLLNAEVSTCQWRFWILLVIGAASTINSHDMTSY